MIANHDIVPVVMFHSVGAEASDWIFSYVSEPIRLFEQKIALLKKKKYNFVFWDDLYLHMAGERQLPKRSIMLTFDDGYLDNWVFAFPILKKYEAKATIFVNPDFVDPSNEIRRCFDQKYSRTNAGEKLEHLGFLNWNEMRAMEASGLVDIQSHSMTHTWYFSSDKVIDFIKTGDKEYPWLAWNIAPEFKPFYMTTDCTGLIPTGTPVYEYEKSLICKRYIPSPKIAIEMVEFVKSIERKNLNNVDWMNNVNKHYQEISKRFEDDSTWESDEEYLNRINDELKTSKRIIEANLDKTVDYICWPGGGYNDRVIEVARAVGYKAWPMSFKSLRWFKNRFNSNPDNIVRVPSYHRYKGKQGSRYGFANHRYFYHGFMNHKGSWMHKIIFAIVRFFGVRLTHPFP